MIDCHHYQKGDCRSCQWLEIPYEQQLAKKEEHLKQQLAKLDCDNLIWHPPFYSSESAFRNKAKNGDKWRGGTSHFRYFTRPE